MLVTWSSTAVDDFQVPIIRQPHRDALAGGMSQFLTQAEPVEQSLLEPLCAHDHQQPCVVYREVTNNPAYRVRQ